MNEEKNTSPATGAGSKTSRNKPVVIYIMILFIAAFLLMALSSLMHQHSNSEVLGELQDSVSTMQQVQESQEKIIELQEELSTTKEELAAIQQELEETTSDQSKQLEAQQIQLTAMTKLYWLQQEYASGDYEACKVIIEDMEYSGIANALPSVPYNTENGTVTAPFVRFQQLKEATLTNLASTGQE